MLPNFSYVRAKSLEEALGHLSSPEVRIHAGGTDLLGCLREEVFKVEKIVSISGLKELKGIGETEDGGLRIGALTTITEIAENPLIQKRYTALAQGASEVASPQLRNQGTLGGNICQKPRCWYYRGDFHCLRKGGETCYAVAGENRFHCIFGGDMCYIVHPSDTAPALMAFGAKVRIAGPKGFKTVFIEEFFVPPSRDVTRETILEANELVVEILLPPPAHGVRSSYRKVRARRSWDFALAGVALVLQFHGDAVADGRVVLSGAAPVPWRSVEVEKIILGKRLDAETMALASRAVVKGAEPLEQNSYKLPLFQGMMEEELEAIAKA